MPSCFLSPLSRPVPKKLPILLFTFGETGNASEGPAVIVSVYSPSFSNSGCILTIKALSSVTTYSNERFIVSAANKNLGVLFSEAEYDCQRSTYIAKFSTGFFVRLIFNFCPRFALKRKPIPLARSSAKYPVSLYGKEISKGLLRVIAAVLSQASPSAVSFKPASFIFFSYCSCGVFLPNKPGPGEEQAYSIKESKQRKRKEFLFRIGINCSNLHQLFLKEI